MTERKSNHRFEMRLDVISLGLVFSAIIIIFRDTISTTVGIWLESDAYFHSFLILPIVGFLIWRERSFLKDLEASTSVFGQLLLVCFSILWLAGDLIGIQVIKQFCVVALVPASVLALFGWQVFRQIRFPLLYLLFVVPVGDFLIPYLIDFTATFTVDALNILGVPVLRDGRYFQIPSGAFEVARACSGLKYVIATMAVTTLFSYFLFASARKRLLFIIFALALSIVMNGIRATTIVLLLHTTDLDIAAGEDHEFVGLIMYGVMIITLILIGRRYQDTFVYEMPKVAPSFSDRTNVSETSVPAFGRCLLIALIAISVGPAIASGRVPNAAHEGLAMSGLPNNVAGWIASEATDIDWQPDYSGYSHMVLGQYRRDKQNVEVALVRYLTQRQGAELTNSTNSVVDTKKWSLDNVASVLIASQDSAPIEVREVLARRSRSRESRLILYWLDVNGLHANSKIQAKLAEIWNLISGKSNTSSAIIISTSVTESEQAAQDVLREFIIDFHGKLESCMRSNFEFETCSLGMTRDRRS